MIDAIALLLLASVPLGIYLALLLALAGVSLLLVLWQLLDDGA